MKLNLTPRSMKKLHTYLSENLDVIETALKNELSWYLYCGVQDGSALRFRYLIVHIKTWMDDEQSVCLTQEDFNLLYEAISCQHALTADNDYKYELRRIMLGLEPYRK